MNVDAERLQTSGLKEGGRKGCGERKHRHPRVGARLSNLLDPALECAALSDADILPLVQPGRREKLDVLLSPDRLAADWNESLPAGPPAEASGIEKLLRRL